MFEDHRRGPPLNTVCGAERGFSGLTRRLATPTHAKTPLTHTNTHAHSQLVQAAYYFSHCCNLFGALVFGVGSTSCHRRQITGSSSNISFHHYNKVSVFERNRTVFTIQHRRSFCNELKSEVFSILQSSIFLKQKYYFVGLKKTTYVLKIHNPTPITNCKHLHHSWTELGCK